MKNITIVGAGMGSRTLTAEGLRALEQADFLLGAPRLIDEFTALGKKSYGEYLPETIARIISNTQGKNYCVLVSGDTGFYSAASGLYQALKDYSPTMLPGISSVNYLFAKLGLPWQDAKLVSCHGRQSNLTDHVRRNRFTFALTGNNIAELAESLTRAGFGELPVYVGENLGTQDERIIPLKASQLIAAGTRTPLVLLIENTHPDSRTRHGIADEMFLRGSTPMTKAEIRAVAMSKLALSPESICCDIGAGTGSMTVEMALTAYSGHVFAVDRSETAIGLITANCCAFGVGNVTPILASAPAALEKLPPCDAAFIGGSSGTLAEIFDLLLAKNPHIRIVINAVTLETINAASAAFTAHGISPEIAQIAVTHLKQVGSMHMLQAATPVFILSGGGNG